LTGSTADTTSCFEFDAHWAVPDLLLSPALLLSPSLPLSDAAGLCPLHKDAGVVGSYGSWLIFLSEQSDFVAPDT